jgi:sulfotransferase family protein
VNASSDRPPPVRIDDLAHPRFADDARAILDVMEEAGSQVVLEPEPLMEAARVDTGLGDFGPVDFTERLDVLCRAMRDEGGFNGAGILQQQVLLVGLLKNRLLLEDLWRRHPEILDEEITKPIIICGLPRTGTTHLHNLMSADPALRSLPYWESLEPVLSDRERPAPGAPDPRLERTAMALSFLDTAMPYFNRMHEMTVEHTHEEIQLLAVDFSTMLFETTAPMPLWRESYLGRDQRASYAYLRRILQALQWLRGGTRWVLKSPQHLEQFPALVETFPDATFVVTHRDPVSVTRSMVMMLAYSARLGRDHVDVAGIGHYWADRLELMLGRCAEQHSVLPADQTIDVHFDEFMADDMAMVARVYDRARQPLDARARAAMTAFMIEHPRGKFGSVEYDLVEFDLDPADLRTALAFYSESFGVRSEV